MIRTRTIIGLAAAGVTALAVAATPALAATAACPPDGNGPNGASQYGVGQGGMGQGGMGQGGMGQNGTGQGGMGQGAGTAGWVAAPSGTLTASQRTEVAAMAEEEKLAHDLYVALAAKFPTAYQFSRVARAETAHLNAVRVLMTRYGITDPTAGRAEGDFASSTFQAMYDSLLASATTTASALAAGIAVEKADIADLTTALSTVTAPDVVQVYTNLRTASQHHLAAFGG
ncbi:MAG: DUF2202 domain-containing protein [Actinomycetota bacterium]|nr:DUF2202 domain-containing protein [Actinomycetota bacterium]